MYLYTYFVHSFLFQFSLLFYKGPSRKDIRVKEVEWSLSNRIKVEKEGLSIDFRLNFHTVYETTVRRKTCLIITNAPIVQYNLYNMWQLFILAKILRQVSQKTCMINKKQSTTLDKEDGGKVKSFWSVRSSNMRLQNKNNVNSSAVLTTKNAAHENRILFTELQNAF